ncbi:MAG: helix-turn-helix domain-containing protein, partial [Magnetococcus sp. XQGC-1]
MVHNLETFVTSSQAARLLNVSQRTINCWVDEGVIKAWKTAGGHSRIPMSAIEQILEKRQEELLEFDQPLVTI